MINRTKLHGPERSLLFSEIGGIGDHIAMLPYVVQLIRAGYDVTVNCKPFFDGIWQNAGVAIVHFGRLGLGWAEENENKYGEIISTNCFTDTPCDPTTPNMESMAKYYSISIPESFSYEERLQPLPLGQKPYVLFAPESSVQIGRAS